MKKLFILAPENLLSSNMIPRDKGDGEQMRLCCTYPGKSSPLSILVKQKTKKKKEK